ncbi:hypothetical protein ACHAPU_011435 [Fusarium lateritium]
MKKIDLASDATAADQSERSREPDKKPASGFAAFLRIFTYCQLFDCALETIAILAAIGSGVSMAVMNLVIGELMDIMGDHIRIATDLDGFMAAVSTNASILYFVYIGIARLGCTYIYSTLFTYVSFRVTNNIRQSYLQAALSQEVSYFDYGTSGSISIQGTSNGNLIQSGIADKLGLFFASLATFTAAFIIAFVSYWKLTLIIICIMPAIMLVIGTMATIDAGLDGKNLKVISQAAQCAETSLASIRTIKAFNLEPRIMHKYTSFLGTSRPLCRKKSGMYGVMFAWQYFVMYAGMSLAFWQGLRMIACGEVEGIGAVFTVLFSVIIGSDSINGIAPNISSFLRAGAGAAELFALVDRTSNINPLDDSGQKPSQVFGVIEIQLIGFSYPTRPDTKVLDDLSLTISARKVTALEPVLFNGTVFENIANGLVGTPWDKATRENQEEYVKHAAKLAFTDKLIQSLPEGYDTRIVQKALDIAFKNRTTLVIAHKLATIRDADNIVVMSKGKIIEQGAHDDLAALNGTYSKLIQAQDLSTSKGNLDIPTSNEESTVSTEVIEPVQSLAKYNSTINENLTSQMNKDDFNFYKSTGLLYTIWKLIVSAHELRAYFVIMSIACGIGAAVYPGQNLLLAEVMDVFTSSDIVKGGDLHYRTGLLRSMLRQGLRFFDRPENTVGALVSRIDTQSQAVLELMGFNVALVLQCIINITSSSILALVYAWKLGLFGVFAGMPPLLLAGYARIRLKTKLNTDIDKRFSTSASIASESVNAIRTVSSLAIEKSVLEKYTAELDRAVSGSTLPLSIMMIWFSLTQSIEFFILALGFWFGSKSYVQQSSGISYIHDRVPRRWNEGREDNMLLGFAEPHTTEPVTRDEV